MTKDEAAFLIAASVRAVSGGGVLAVSAHDVADHLETRSGLPDSVLREMCAAFGAKCKSGHSDPVECSSVLVAAVYCFRAFCAEGDRREKARKAPLN
jgi:hypothetical protein